MLIQCHSLNQIRINRFVSITYREDVTKKIVDFYIHNQVVVYNRFHKSKLLVARIKLDLQIYYAENSKRTLDNVLINKIASLGMFGI